MIVSFSGIDGCGKTTLAKEAVKFLKSKGARVWYIRPADISMDRKIGNAFGKVSEKKAKGLSKSPNFFIAWLRKLSLLADACSFRFGTLLLGHGKVIVCDRYYYDRLVHLEYCGISTRFINGLVLAMAPKPDIAFLVTAPVETALARDKESEKGFYKTKAGLYAKVFSRLDFVMLENKSLPSTTAKLKAVLKGAVK